MAVTAAEFATWTQEWQSSLRAVRSALPPPPPPGSACWEDAEPWRALACSRLHPGGTCSDSPLRARECDRSCGRCTASAPPRPVVAPSAASSCALVAHRHIAKTGGASVRDWMFQLDKRGEGRFYGPATWMRWKGRCQIGRYLHCCNPTDERPTAKCEALRLVEARAIAVELLANASARGRDGGRGDGGLGAAGLTMLEFHWPDSALGKWGKPGPSEEKALARSPPGLAEAGAFLRLLPFMRPHALPGCRVVTATVLREPAALYPSLMRHQLGSMRTYGFETLSARCGCNLTACDAVGFVAAFPDFQGWRLTSARWLYPPLASVGHRRMCAAARFDLAGRRASPRGAAILAEGGGRSSVPPPRTTSLSLAGHVPGTAPPPPCSTPSTWSA